MSDNKNILPFNGTKYSIWKSRVRALIDETILDNNALSIIDNDEKPDNVSAEEWLKRNKIAKGIIIRNLSDSIVGYATEDPNLSARNIFKKLDETYMRKSLATELSLEIKLLTFKYKENTTMLQHFMFFDELIADMEAASGDKLKEANKIARLLTSLPKSYTPLVVAIQTLTDDKLNLSFVKVRLLDYETQLNNEQKDTETKVLIANKNDKFNKQHHNKKEIFHTNQQNNSRFKKYKTFNKNKYNNKNKSFKNNNIKNKNFKKCEYCGRQNHLKDECYYYKKICNEQSTNTAFVQQEDHFACMIRSNNSHLKQISFINGQKNIQFILDSGATDHLVNNLDVFSSIEDLIEPIVITVAKKNEVITATKRGTICVTTDKGFNGTLKNVLYTPDIPFNLLSVKRIQQNGMDVIFKATGEVLVKRNGQVFMNIVSYKNLSYVEFIIRNKKCNLIETNNTFSKYNLWHQRLGHIEKSKFLQLKNNNFISNENILKSIVPNEELCEACVMSKQTRLPFNKRKDRSHITRPLFAIHTDVCGPIRPSTIDNKSYFVTFIDEFTHYVVVYLITYKSEVFKVFQDFINKSEARFSNKITYLYCDNGNEYLSNDFKDFCSNRGIQYHLTVPYTPQQNSIAERMNRTLVEKARAMLHGANLGKEFWGEAVLTAAYIINITPTKSLILNKTPYELWHNKKPSVDRLKIFGCTVYMLDKTKREKFDSKSIKGILVGYLSNGYKVYNTNTNKFVVTRDVTFDEVNFKTSRPVTENEYANTDKRKFEISKESSLNKETDVNNKISINNNLLNNQEINKSVCKTDGVNETDKYKEISNSSNKKQRIELNIEKEKQNEKTNENILRSSERLKYKPKISYDESEDNYHICAQSTIYDIPQCYYDIEKHPNKFEWKRAVMEEIDSLAKNNTWTLVPCPPNKNIINSRWVFTIKNKGKDIQYKARLVAKGFSQQYLQDYFETFAPVARITTLRIMLALANQYDLLIHQMDVKTAFLNGKLEEDIYMKVPDGIHSKPNYVCKLNKALYGLKQAARCWFQLFDQAIKQYGFQNSSVDTCLYFIDNNHISKNTYLLLYVDDILIFTNCLKTMENIKKYLTYQFSMKDMKEIKTFLGINITRTKNKISLDQSDYLEKVLDKFNMSNCNSISNPLPNKLDYESLNSDIPYDAPCRELIGCLMYAMLCTRPDLCISLNLLSRYQTKSNVELWQHLKRILRYIKGSIHLKLTYDKNDFENVLNGYVDADWANDTIDRKSTSGYIFSLFDKCTISWNSKRQNSVATSSTEAEYMALFEAVREACWLRSLMKSIKYEMNKPTPLFEDNNSCIAIANNPTDHKRSKHIDIKYHSTREKIEQKLIILKYVSTDNQLADAFTKPLATSKFQKLRNEMGLK